MHTVASQLFLASITKHQEAGIVAIVVAIVLFVLGGIRIAAKAAGAVLFPILGVLAAILAVLLFTRAI